MASTKYTSLQLVKGKLPRSYSSTDLPDSSDATYESITTKILNYSRYMDTIMGGRYCSFNSTDHGTYPTPGVIVRAATFGVAGDCLFQVMAGDANSPLAQAAKDYVTESKEMISAIISEENSQALDPEVVSSETLVFGTGGNYALMTNQAYINVHSNLTTSEIPTIIEDSVRVTNTAFSLYHYKRDFDVAFNPEHQKWVFTDIVGQFKADTGALTISYKWDYRRASQHPKTISATATSLLGGW
jgi:hypothetical protein